MYRGITVYQDLGIDVARHALQAMLAEAYGKVGQVEKGLHTVAAGLAVVDKFGSYWWEAELYRLRGELFLMSTRRRLVIPEAATCFRKALDVARQQDAKSWELRAAMSLSRLWRQQGRCQQAHDLLAPIYDWFTEGLETPDLQDAQRLLEDLRA